MPITVDDAISIKINHFIGESIEDFVNAESLGRAYDNQHTNSYHKIKANLSLKEEIENKLIEEGLSFKGNYWEVAYPWIKDPHHLPSNRYTAYAMLKSTEKRSMKDEMEMYAYQTQVQDMIDRKVARKLTDQELRRYNGPVHYIPHHEVLKPDSESTPCRIVFNSSSNFKGHILNNYWAKDSTLIYNLPAILLRLRENYVGVIGDIQKMYHSIRISKQDQHTHRFLWRNFEVQKEPSTYVMTSVCFGGRPAGTIAIMALNKTAEMAGEGFADAKDTVINNAYVDDIIDSYDSHNKCRDVTD